VELPGDLPLDLPDLLALAGESGLQFLESPNESYLASSKLGETLRLGES
jgi:hypothetical protein